MPGHADPGVVSATIITPPKGSFFNTNGASSAVLNIATNSNAAYKPTSGGTYTLTATFTLTETGNPSDNALAGSKDRQSASFNGHLNANEQWSIDPGLGGPWQIFYNSSTMQHSVELKATLTDGTTNWSADAFNQYTVVNH